MDDVLDLCRHWLGPVDVIADHSWPHGVNVVLELRDRHGRPWIAKGVRQPDPYRREAYAYERWVPALAPDAPLMRFRDDNAAVFVLEMLPGRIAEDTPLAVEPDVFRQAGALIRRLNDLEAGPQVEMRSALLDKLEERFATYPVRPTDQPWVDFVVDTVAGMDPVTVQYVPTHGDNHPRNWLVDDDGVVRLIDFGHATLEWWGRDLLRMSVKHWLARPDLQAAYLDGHGRSISPSDEVLLRVREAHGALTVIFWARKHGDPEFEQAAFATLARLGAPV